VATFISSADAPKEINDRACVATIDDLPDGIDAAVLVVPQQAVVEAVAACGRRHIGGAVVFASGFAETGDEGRAEQERLRETARAGGVRVLGPNCMGFTNFVDATPLTFEHIRPEPIAGRPAVGVVAQSGALSGVLRIALSAKGLGVSHAISTGNEADLTSEDFVSFLLDDPQRVRSCCSSSRSGALPCSCRWPSARGRSPSRSCCCIPARAAGHVRRRARIPARWRETMR